VLPESGRDEIGFSFRQQTGETNQQNSLAGTLLPENELTKVLVGGDQESACLTCELQHEFVTDPGIKLGYVGDLEPVQAKAINDLPIDTFVGDELQAASWGMG
jgi:hypothetical protein